MREKFARNVAPPTLKSFPRPWWMMRAGIRHTWMCQIP